LENIHIGWMAAGWQIGDAILSEELYILTFMHLQTVVVPGTC